MVFKNPKYGSLLNECDLAYFLNRSGEKVSSDSISEVIKTHYKGYDIFIKKYYKPGKSFIRKLSNFIPFIYSKGLSEYNNLSYFSHHDFLTPDILFFDEQKGQSCLVTLALSNSVDLSKYYSQFPPRFTSRHNNAYYLFDFAFLLAKLHKLGFIHRDYKLRNVLLSQDKKLYLIDCPNGFKKNRTLAKEHYITRDLAIVYKDLKKVLSKTQMLRLYKHYYNLLDTFDEQSKHKIKQILRYY